MRTTVRAAAPRQTAIPIAVMVTVSALAASPAFAQGHGGEELLSRQEILYGIAHGVVLTATVFLVGLILFSALVWLPTSRSDGVGPEAIVLFKRWTWLLFGLLVLSGLVELSAYAVRASGDPFSPGLFVEALITTRTGHTWLAHIGLALLMSLVVNAATDSPGYWWAAGGIGSILLMTLTRLSHAASEGGFLPLLADWLHLNAGSLWMGGLLGFPIVLMGVLRKMPLDRRAKLREKTVRRFSKVATVAVLTLAVTGGYAILLHIPSIEALFTTPYGRALIMKLGLLVLLLAAGGINLADRGSGPFGRMVGAELVLALAIFAATGFLTSLPPP